MKYDPATHSPIFGPDEKPVNVGWYASTTFVVDRWCLVTHYIEDSKNSAFWWYWDGEKWKDFENGSPASFQNRCWFGLREKPEEVK